MKPVICKETAEASIAQFKAAWKFEDPKEIVSGGRDSSIPEEMSVMMTSNIMMGHIEISPDGKVVKYNLRDSVGERTSIEFKQKRLKNHMVRDLKDASDELDALAGLLEIMCDVSKYEFSELDGRDTTALLAIMSYVNFT